MPPGPVHQLNHSACQTDFTPWMVLDTVKIQDAGEGKKSIASDLEAVLRKIENWHQGSIAGYQISFRDTRSRAPHRVEW